MEGRCAEEPHQTEEILASVLNRSPRQQPSFPSLQFAHGLGRLGVSVSDLVGLVQNDPTPSVRHEGGGARLGNRGGICQMVKTKIYTLNQRK